MNFVSSGLGVVQESVKLRTVKLQYEQAKLERAQRQSAAPSITQNSWLYEQVFSSFHAATPKGTDKETSVKTKPKEKEKEKEKEKDKSKDEDKEEEQKGKADPVQSVLLLTMMVLTTLAAAYYGSRQAGKAWFLRQLEELADTVTQDSLVATRFWVSERKQLGLPIPQVVLDDLHRLERLVDLVERLNTGKEDMWASLGWLALFVGATGAVSGHLLRQKGKTPADFLRRLGLGMSATSVISLLVLKGMYSASHFQVSRQRLSAELATLCGAYSEEEDVAHSRVVVSSFGAAGPLPTARLPRRPVDSSAAQEVTAEVPLAVSGAKGGVVHENATRQAKEKQRAVEQ